MKKLFTSIAFTFFLSIFCHAQVFEWVKTYSVNSYDVINGIGRYFGDSVITFHLQNNYDTIININSRGNELKRVIEIKGKNYVNDFYYLQPGPNSTLFSRSTQSLYNKNLDTIKTFPLFNKDILVAFSKDGSQFESNIRSGGNNLPLYFRLKDKNGIVKYDIPFASNLFGAPYYGGSNWTLFTLDEDKNFYFSGYGTFILGNNTFTIGGQNFSMPNSRNYIFSLDSNGAVRYLIKNPLYDQAFPGKMKVGNDKNLYLINAERNTLQKIDPRGNVLWSYSNTSTYKLGAGLDLDDSCNAYICFNSTISKIDSSGNLKFTKSILNGSGYLYSLLVDQAKNEIFVTGVLGTGSNVFDCITVGGSKAFVAKLYTGTIPSFVSISLSGINLNSNISQGNYWYRNDTLLANETKSSVLLLRDGRYSLKAYCKQDSIKFDGISTNTLTGLLITFSIPGANYQWFLNGGTILGATQFSYLPTANGTYSVVINFDPSAVPNGRTEGSSNTKTAIYKTQVTNVITDNKIFDLPSFKLYPNPNYGEFTVNLINNSSSNLEVMDMTGRVVYSHVLKELITNLQLQHLGKGVFSLKIGNQVKSIVIW